MKKISIMLMFVATLFVAASCSDDSGKDISLDKLEIIKSDVEFGNTASVGKIEVNATGNLTVKSSEPWCKVSANGNVVTVNVDALTEREARSAMVSITDGVRSVDVPVYQYGVIFGLKGEDQYIITKEGGTELIPGKINIDYDFDASADWLSATYTDGGVEITLLPNDGPARRGTITVTSSMGTKEFTFIQLGNETIEGTYKAIFRDYDDDGNLVWEEKEITIDKDADGNYQLNNLSFVTGLVIPFAYDEDTHLFTQGNTTLLGQVTLGTTTYYARLITIGYKSTDGNYYISSSTAYKVAMGYSWNETDDCLSIKVIDTGTMIGYEQVGFNVQAYSSATSVSSSYNKGYLDTFYNLELMKK